MSDDDVRMYINIDVKLFVYVTGGKSTLNSPKLTLCIINQNFRRVFSQIKLRLSASNHPHVKRKTN